MHTLEERERQQCCNQTRCYAYAGEVGNSEGGGGSERVLT